VAAGRQARTIFLITDIDADRSGSSYGGECLSHTGRRIYHLVGSWVGADSRVAGEFGEEFAGRSCGDAKRRRPASPATRKMASCSAKGVRSITSTVAAAAVAAATN